MRRVLNVEDSFVFVLCGAGRHAERLAIALRHLRYYSQKKIIVVVDGGRGSCLIAPGIEMIDHRVPGCFTDKQASRLLKTSLHRILAGRRGRFCYLDCDVLALSSEVDQIFEAYAPPVTFASDHCPLKEFAGAAIVVPEKNTSATELGELFSTYARRDFEVSVESTHWHHFNGGVFLFSEESVPFMETWHAMVQRVLVLKQFWTVRDQGALAMASWRHKLVEHARLPKTFNYIVDANNSELQSLGSGRFLQKRGEGVSRPAFAHIFHRFHDRSWSVWNDVETFGLTAEARDRGPLIF